MAALGILFALTTTGACASDENTLSGSLSQVYAIHFESTRARLYSSELSVEYVDHNGAVPVRLTLRRVEVQPAADHQYNLIEVGDITGRSSSDAEIPRFTEGTLDLVEFLYEDDTTVSGSFDAKFATSRDSLSLSGEFVTELDLVGGQ